MRSRDAVNAIRSILKGILNLTPIASNSTPANGDLWVTSAGVQTRVNGATVQQIDSSMKASTTEALAGTNTDKFVTPATASQVAKRQALLAIALGG